MKSVSHFNAADRSANYGDGVFTTMHLIDGKIALFKKHIQRMVEDAAIIGLEVTGPEIIAQIRDNLPENFSGVVKCLISAGEGGRGYSRLATPNSVICITCHHLPEHYKTWQSTGICMGVSDVKLAHQPMLAGVKHNNRLEQVLIKRDMQNRTIDDVIVCDYNGNIVEASAANVFWCVDGKWFTPSVKSSGVNGVMRRFILEHCPDVEVGDYPLSDLCSAQALFISNALMQIIPVRLLETNAGAKPLDVLMVQRFWQSLQSLYDKEYLSAS